MSWESILLGDFLTLKRGYDLPNKQRKDGTVPVVSSSGITGWHNISKVDGPGVVTGRYGTLGEVYFISDNFWPLNTSLYVQDFKGNDRRFVSYFLKSILKGTTSNKAAVPGVNRNDLHRRKVIATTNIRLQKSIVSILSAYDDLIENNRRRIQLLEQAARLLYKEWFVHLRFPGHEHTKINDGVPEGWKVKTLDELTTKIGSGATPRGGAAAYKEKGITLIRSLNVYDYQFEDSGLAFIDEEQAGKLANVIVAPDDILLNITGASVGRCCIVPDRHLPARVNQHVMIIRANPDLVGPCYLLCSINSDQRKQYILNIARAGGATREALTKNVVGSLRIPIPTKNIIEIFEKTVGNFFKQQQNLASQNNKLAKARDLLLPRLMNGEVAI